MIPKMPIDFVAIRVALVRAIKQVTQIECILEEQKSQTAQALPRPPLPYMSFKFTTPAAKTGDDHDEQLSATSHNRGGVRRMSVSFHCYAGSPEEAYNYMSLWQSSLELETIQELLRRSGIAVWLIGGVADLTQLLQTGFEARSQMDVQFGIAFNLTEDVGTIETVSGDGTIIKEDDTTETVGIFITV